MAYESPRPDNEIPGKKAIPSEVSMRICARIEPEAADGLTFVTGLEQRYGILTGELPLAGGDALRPIGPARVPALTQHLLGEAPWLETAIDRIDVQLRLQLWAGRPWIAFRPLLLVGPPGCGKSHLARLIASQAGTGHAVLDLAGVTDNRALEGTARGWSNAQPCFPALAISQAGTANPIVMLEEIDKVSPKPNAGDPLATLLTMIEPSTARTYYDKCLLAPLDLSHVNWIMTANDAAGLPAPLRSRLDIITVSGPGPGHFDALLRSLLRDLALRWALPPPDIPDLHPAAIALLRTRFEQHRSVRRLAREMESAIAAVIPTLTRPTH